MIKISSRKIIRNSLIPLWSFLLTVSAFGQSHRIDFVLDMQSTDGEQVGVRGNIPPLSWEETFFLQDEDGDGSYTGTLILDSPESELQFKFVKNKDEHELHGEENRVLPLNAPQLKVEETFNVRRPLGPSELEAIRFTPEEVREDIGVLRLGLRSIHPNLYRYIDSVALNRAFEQLEQQLRQENNLPSAYKYITQFIARIQCSHTITNPRNQKPLIKQALYLQRDKVPFTFRLIGDRLFVDNNASEDERLQRGVEVLSINDVAVPEILSRLVPYISADGGNDAKRRYELQLNGMDRYEAFDIVFPLEFGSRKTFSLEVKDQRDGQTFTTRVAAQTKSKRTRILQERNPKLGARIDDIWQFEVLNPQTAYLKLGTFSIWNMEMNWKQFLKDAFKTLDQREIPNLIIDIRGNVGGADEVYAFLLQRLIRQPISIERRPSKIAYQTIPQALRPHISTWDKSVFELGGRVIPQPDGYFLEKMTNTRPMVFKPRKDGFRGRTFVITDAANSSATHLMATLIKEHEIATLVGQTTGGNQRGLNGGMMFFTTLPNTRIEVDIPVYGSYTEPGTPDGGIEPEVMIEKNVEDFIWGRDTEVEKILEIISGMAREK